MADSIHILAPAKINLALSVGPSGQDRMHPIASWMITVDLVDEVEIVRRDDPPMSLYGVTWHEDALHKPEIDWPMSSDLAARAHQALEKHVGRTLPVRLKIEKRIPPGSGLGGGSADAAAVLRGVNELFELELSETTLAEIGATIGSDVPFQIHGGSAVVEGLGESVERHERLPEIDAVLILPEARCSTAEVYGWFDDLAEEFGEKPMRSDQVRRSADAPLTPETPFNDLADPALRASPILEEMMKAVSELAERPAHITGSGAGFFVLCDESFHAEALAAAITERLDLP
ncbi:MAG TPA: 4-(cytidine 5'-diphospho)-2-C-methyl-D-erythritol kinase, partial [Phycisphaerales bacterium]|nr:4-(cytidine 5'-diphospho)-2-C-methyl-D-erythritol kinase [Phycisphaerales bacterium]